MKRRDRRQFWVLLGLLLGLIFVRYALQVDFPRSILLLVAVLAAVLGDWDEIIAVCICCIPLHTAFHYIYALLFCIAIYAVKYSSGIRLNLSIVPVLLMILWELLHCFGEPFSAVHFAGDCIPLLLLALLMCSRDRAFDYDFIVRALAVATAAMCMVLLGKLVYLADFDLAAAFSSLQRLGLDSEETRASLAVAGGEQNPNTLGILCVLAATGLLQLRTAGRGGVGETALVVVLLLFGSMTSSRTYLVCLALMAVLLLFAQPGSLGGKFRFLGALVLVLVLALAVLYAFFPELMAYYASRFEEADLTTGRMGLMEIYHEFIVSDPEIAFFGIGLHDFSDKVLLEYTVAEHVPHNGIQELVIAWGLPGLVLFGWMWTEMVLRSRSRGGRRTLLHYIPLLILLAKIQAGQMLTSSYTMLAFSYAYLSMCADLRPKRI